MDLHWLTAPDDEVAAAMAALRRADRRPWVPTRRGLLVHINWCLMLWYIGIAGLGLGVQIDTLHDNVLTASDVVAVVVCLLVLALWLVGTRWLIRWSRRPPSPRARMREWRQTLTALANGYEPEPRPEQTFPSTLLPRVGRLHSSPRFVGAGIQFGVLTQTAKRTRQWRFVAVTLDAPLPNLVLDATANDAGNPLAVQVDRGQRLRLEGDFDRVFRAYSPTGYGRDALYVLTPDVMAALMDTAAHSDVEILDRTLVFLDPGATDFSRPETWTGVEAIVERVAPRVAASARRYLDERVPGQEVPRMLAEARATALDPATPWTPPPPRIGPDGDRLLGRRRDSGPRYVLGAVAWIALLVFLYPVPGIFGFAGVMSILDGR